MKSTYLVSRPWMIPLHLKTVFFYKARFKSIGLRSTIKKPLLITFPRHIDIGDRVSIRNGVRLEIVLDGINKNPKISIGDHTNLEQNVHIACHSKVEIGRFVSIAANCGIVDITHPFQYGQDLSSYAARIDTKPSFVEIGDCCFIGFGTVILPNVRIGHHSIIGANSVVTRDIPEFCVAYGNPARIIKKFDALSGSWIAADQNS